MGWYEDDSLSSFQLYLYDRGNYCGMGRFFQLPYVKEDSMAKKVVKRQGGKCSYS